jgi:hypothetical protein
MKLLTTVLMIGSLAGPAAAQAGPPEKKRQPYRLPTTERMAQVLWGSECLGPDGLGLSFGGEDQKAEDGAAHTRIKTGEQWQPILEQLRASNPLQASRDAVWAIRGQVKDAAAKLRFIYFEGAPGGDQAKAANVEAVPLLRAATGSLAALTQDLSKLLQSGRGLEEYHRDQIGFALAYLGAGEGIIKPASNRPAQVVSADDIKALWQAQVHLEQAAEAMDAEPPPRALSPIVYDPKSKLYVVFGGDHLDYLTNDTWVFEPGRKLWRQRHPKSAPPPRANHQLSVDGGKVKLSGGYTYYNDIWYCGGPYIDLGDGDWTYDAAADTWVSGAGQQGTAPDSRVYRQKEFHPDFFLQGDRPDAAAFAGRLKELPGNTWVLTKPPQLPKMNRDWGTAVIDPDHDVLLRWSGGHSAHGGSDVLMFHFATNRWELPFPIEFPLGQTYSNTSYPDGVNFNLRPWVTGHTYKAYDYDPIGRAMVFVGHSAAFNLFDPSVGDWTGRGDKPSGMCYSGCFYDLLCKRTPRGVVCWTNRGQLFRYDAKARRWDELKASGAKLPGSKVDAAGIDYDAKRDRLLLFPCQYGKGYSGQIVAVDPKGMVAANLDPAGMPGASKMPGLLRESCYVPCEDLVLIGVAFPPDQDGLRWTPAYDCAANKWIALKIGGPHPAGKEGRNVSMGLVYDARRNLVWAVDTNGVIHVLRLETKTIGRKEL